MYVVVTGAAGFIGSNLVEALNNRGVTNIVAVDNLTRADKFKNLVDLRIADYLDKEEFLSLIRTDAFEGSIDAVLHQGACSDTLESNGRYMMENNYRYSVTLLNYCQEHDVPFIYASSASVYGGGKIFQERPEHEAPLNVYGYSKFLFDQHVRTRFDEFNSQVAGLRYFNVYGPRESHKARMASVALHFFNEYRSEGRVKLFEGSHGYAAGEQRRDFVSVEDVVKVNLFFLDRPERTGIFNVGTGAAQSFHEVAVTVVNACRSEGGESALSLEQMLHKGLIQYIPFPEALKDKYQSYTQADLAQLRRVGYTSDFLSVQQGVKRYAESLLRR